MARHQDAILLDIATFAPSNGDWRVLEFLLNELWSNGVREDDLPALFRVFERYPDDDGEGVLWSIVHGVETLPFIYEQALRESVSRRSSFMGEVMLKRLARAQNGSAPST